MNPPINEGCVCVDKLESTSCLRVLAQAPTARADPHHVARDVPPQETRMISTYIILHSSMNMV